MLTVPVTASKDSPPSPDPEDWDRSFIPTPEATPPVTPETKARSLPSTPNRVKRSLQEVLKVQARLSMGKDEAEIDEEEGRRVVEELGEWVNSDVSPYETARDSFFEERKSSDSECSSPDDDRRRTQDHAKEEDHSSHSSQSTD